MMDISGNAGYHSVQNLLPYRLLCRSVKIAIQKTEILPVVLDAKTNASEQNGRSIPQGKA
jgi:hypothetical protein